MASSLRRRQPGSPVEYAPVANRFPLVLPWRSRISRGPAGGCELLQLSSMRRDCHLLPRCRHPGSSRAPGRPPRQMSNRVSRPSRIRPRLSKGCDDPLQALFKCGRWRERTRPADIKLVKRNDSTTAKQARQLAHHRYGIRLIHQNEPANNGIERLFKWHLARIAPRRNSRSPDPRSVVVAAPFRQPAAPCPCRSLRLPDLREMRTETLHLRSRRQHRVRASLASRQRVEASGA
jgi:hypothetical protein